MAAERIATFTAGQLERLAKALGATHGGLTGAEIGQALRQARIPDVDPTNTKWKRIYNALARCQNKARAGTCVLNLVHHAMEPARYVGVPEDFERRREEINNVLAFVGLRFSENGKFVRVKRAETLRDARRRATQLQRKLKDRSVHPEVLTFCRAELLADNYFHAVFEATKSISAKVRQRTGLDGDGSDLFQRALGGSAPALLINPGQTESHRSEQRGFVHLLKGLYGLFRTPMAHEPRIEWDMPEEDALDLLVAASYVHRRLDRATAVRTTQTE